MQYVHSCSSSAQLSSQLTAVYCNTLHTLHNTAFSRAMGRGDHILFSPSRVDIADMLRGQKVPIAAFTVIAWGPKTAWLYCRYLNQHNSVNDARITINSSMQ